MALNIIVDKIANVMDSNDVTYGIFIDLAKAFDTVDHSVLIRKLKHYGLRGITSDWVTSYLSERSQIVSFKGTLSSCMNVKCGVPQGSILGPLFFIIYINDCVNVSNVLNFVKFADDTNVFCSGTNAHDLSNTLNLELEKLSDWFRANKLSLNIEKTKFIYFSKRRKKNDFEIKIDGKKIQQVQNIKFLGIQIDEKLTWLEHLKALRKKLSRNIGVICRLKYKLPVEILHYLYTSLIMPYLQYCNIVWGRNYDIHLEAIFKLQKKSIRIITKSNYLEHTSPLFKNSKLLKLRDINKLQLGCFMYQYKNNVLPKCFEHYFINQNEVHNHHTRNCNNHFVGNFRTNVKCFSLQIAGPVFWNSLDRSIKDSRSLDIFRNRLKN